MRTKNDETNINAHKQSSEEVECVFVNKRGTGLVQSFTETGDCRRSGGPSLLVPTQTYAKGRSIVLVIVSMTPIPSSSVDRFLPC